MSVVSVVIPVKNGEKFLEEALGSILNQTLRDIEVIVINDHSTDGTAEVCKKLALSDNRLKVFEAQGHGIVDALNQGVAVASSKYIARMDGDDISEFNRLEYQYNFLESHPEISILGTDITIFGWSKLLGFDKDAEETITFENESDRIIANLESASKFFVLAHPSVMMIREHIVSLGGYRKVLPLVEDLDLWMRASLAGKRISNINKPLLRYRESGFNLTSNNREQRYLNTAVLLHYYRNKKIFEPKNSNTSISISNLRLYALENSLQDLIADFSFLIKGTPEHQRIDICNRLITEYSHEIEDYKVEIREKIYEYEDSLNDVKSKECCQIVNSLGLL